MDRRRLLMNALAFPDNYLFKEGLGIKEELGYLFSAYSGSSASLSKEEIYLRGGNETHGGIIFGENAKWVKGNYPDQTRYLFSDGLDLSEYKT
ncbi:MAG: hypothetical protein J6Q10_00465, partial [Clostridia bacterium]|nr:hypothetical protein [Clostridia bacterium]